jgi:DNA polymerase alpha subunit B
VLTAPRISTPSKRRSLIFESSDKQIIDSVVTINPSNLAKANSGGTYCKMTIHPVPQPDLDKAIDEGDLEDELRVFERTRVDLVRI